MSEATHTPGPWKVLSSEPDALVVTPDGRTFNVGDTLYHADNIANARLIAACPDLYRELAYLVSMIEPLEREGRIQIPGIATLNGARAALAKARGQ